MNTDVEATGPDFSVGIGIDDVPEHGTLSGRVGDEPVLVSRFEGKFFAVSGSCTHYGASLASGLVDGEAVRCPLHHACFSLRTGAVLRTPALNPLDLWQVEVEDGTVFVRRKAKLRESVARAQQADPKRIVIVGGGAAGLACANELRRLGYSDAVTMLSADRDPPVDRPNLSKDYLAGTAPEEWMPLRSDNWYADNGIDLRLGTEIVRIDPAARTVHSTSGEEFAFDRLLLATGSEPNRLLAHGFDDDAVLTLRSFADARAIADRAKPDLRVAIIGSSFIGLEAAAALRKRNVEVHIVSPEHVPFQSVFGDELGSFVRSLHEQHGVRFHLGSAAASFDGSSVTIASGERIPADFVLVGVGVRPRVSVAESAGIATANGLLVDDCLQTSIPGIYAAGDIAAYPDPLTGGPVRIEHWVTAQRQGQTAAANMLGLRLRYQAVPFFWTEQYGVSIRYVGHAPRWDDVIVDGDVQSGDFIARYFDKGAHRASAAVGRDLEILGDELQFEKLIVQAAPNAPAGGNLHRPPASNAPPESGGARGLQ